MWNGFKKGLYILVVAVSISLFSLPAFAGDGQKPGEPLPLPSIGPSGG